MSVEFDTPANRIIAQQQPKNQFRIDTSLPDIAFLRHLSVQGRLRYFQATVTNAAPLTITPNNGETMFVYRVISSLVSGGNISFLNDGQTRYTSGSAVAIPVIIDLMDSLVGDSIKAFTVTASAGSQLVSVFAWIENTSRIRDVTT